MVISIATGIRFSAGWERRETSPNSACFYELCQMFVIGGITGVMVAAVPFDIHVHDTYFVIGSASTTFCLAIVC